VVEAEIAEEQVTPPRHVQQSRARTPQTQSPQSGFRSPQIRSPAVGRLRQDDRVPSSVHDDALSADEVSMSLVSDGSSGFKTGCYRTLVCRRDNPPRVAFA
jgi:hypothetical protein